MPKYPVTTMENGIAPKGTPKVADNTTVKGIKPSPGLAQNLDSGTNVILKGKK